MTDYGEDDGHDGLLAGSAEVYRERPGSIAHALSECAARRGLTDAQLAAYLGTREAALWRIWLAVMGLNDAPKAGPGWDAALATAAREAGVNAEHLGELLVEALPLAELRVPLPAPSGPCSTHPPAVVYQRIAPDGTRTITYGGPDGREAEIIPPCPTCGHLAWREGQRFTVHTAPSPAGGVPFLRPGYHF
jgi:hypothetical protein